MAGPNRSQDSVSCRYPRSELVNVNGDMRIYAETNCPKDVRPAAAREGVAEYPLVCDRAMSCVTRQYTIRGDGEKQVIRMYELCDVSAVPTGVRLTRSREGSVMYSDRETVRRWVVEQMLRPNGVVPGMKERNALHVVGKLLR